MIYRIIYLFCLFFSLFCRFYQTTSRLYQDSPEPGILVYNGPVKKFRVRNGREEEEDLDKNEKDKKKLFYREALLSSIEELKGCVDYIDWKQDFYDDVLSGKRPYISNLIPAE
ncbi:MULTISPECIES: hypothetical protein [unclassified Blautia]|uniref:hypothetical protein n=1 Tax=unclassified Blautia TaxID=2648079 RepID=UPI000B551EAB|nr:MULTISPECIES: hypothetical protein [unclassified Blautia]OUN25480.1 hypothetical protein B5G33_17805 [Blautia sp. An81]OUN90407.1 hypothetical protein B5G00_16285 [Blautia sp. An46]